MKTYTFIWYANDLTVHHDCQEIDGDLNIAKLWFQVNVGDPNDCSLIGILEGAPNVLFWEA